MSEYRRAAFHAGTEFPPGTPDEDEDVILFYKTVTDAAGTRGLYGWDGTTWAKVGFYERIILTKSSGDNQDVGGVNGSETWWTWDGEDYKDPLFDHSTVTNPGRVTVGADGWYHVRFCANVQQTGSARTTLQGIVRVNGGTTQRKGSIRDYTRGSVYGNASPGLECTLQLNAGDYIEVGTRIEDTDSTYTLYTNGSEIDDDENVLEIERVG